MTHLTMSFYWLQGWLCAEITINSPLVTVTMASEGRALSTQLPLQPFSHAAFTSYGYHGDEQSEHDCTLRQKGRYDAPPPAPTRYGFHFAVSEAFDLSIYEQLSQLNSGSCGGTCKHTVHKVLQRSDWNTCLGCLYHISLDQGVNC